MTWEYKGGKDLERRGQAFMLCVNDMRVKQLVLWNHESIFRLVVLIQTYLLDFTHWIERMNHYSTRSKESSSLLWGLICIAYTALRIVVP